MPDINGEMKAAADYAIRLAKEKFLQEFDYSAQSIYKLENLLIQAHHNFVSLPKDEQSSKAISRTAAIWGSLLGEFMLIKWGGTWVMKDSERLISINNIEFSPINFVYHKIMSQPDYSVEKYLLGAECQINPSAVILQQSQTPSENISQPNMNSKETLLEMLSSDDPEDRWDACVRLEPGFYAVKFIKERKFDNTPTFGIKKARFCRLCICITSKSLHSTHL